MPGCEVDVLGHDATRLLAERRYDLVHVCVTGRAGITALQRAHLAACYGQCAGILSPCRAGRGS